MRGLRARLLERIRSRILAAVAEFYGLGPDDEVGLAGEPQELTDAIMAALFPPKKETPHELRPRLLRHPGRALRILARRLARPVEPDQDHH